MRPGLATLANAGRSAEATRMIPRIPRRLAARIPRRLAACLLLTAALAAVSGLAGCEKRIQEADATPAVAPTAWLA